GLPCIVNCRTQPARAVLGLSSTTTLSVRLRHQDPHRLIRNHRQGLKRMSGPSTYQPNNAFLKWFEARLPIGGLIHSSFVSYPTPKNLNYWWTFGAILSFMLGAQIVTGVILTMHYTPHVDMAFNSVEHIM